MKKVLKIIFVVLPLSVALILLLSLILADRWLESSAGRQRLEAALADSLGMPVNVRGDFSIRLLPSVGVSGTDLLIGDSDGSGSFVESETFHANIALRPLIDQKLHILAFSAAHGLLDPQEFRQRKRGGADTTKSSLELPWIEQLVLEDFGIALPGSSLLVQKLELKEFQAGNNAALNFELSLHSAEGEIAAVTALTSLLVRPGAEQIIVEIEEFKIESETQTLEGITGDISWRPEQQLLETRLAWQGDGVGAFQLSGSLHTAAVNGSIAMDFLAPGIATPLRTQLDFTRQAKGIEFPSIQLSFDDQRVAGSGCLLSENKWALNLDLTSDYVNLDQLKPLYSGAGAGGDKAGLTFELNFAFSALEAHAGGAVVRNTVISTGKQPDCSLLLD